MKQKVNTQRLYKVGKRVQHFEYKFLYNFTNILSFLIFFILKIISLLIFSSLVFTEYHYSIKYR